MSDFEVKRLENLAKARKVKAAKDQQRKEAAVKPVKGGKRAPRKKKQLEVELIEERTIQPVLTSNAIEKLNASAEANLQMSKMFLAQLKDIKTLITAKEK